VNEKALEARREYQREWRKANREKVRIHNARYWAKRAELSKAKIKKVGDESD